MSNALCTDYAGITELRATDPGAIDRAWQNRTTRPAVRGNGRLMIVAADHPARGALAVRRHREQQRRVLSAEQHHLL